jgi:hypothetical protein
MCLSGASIAYCISLFVNSGVAEAYNGCTDGCANLDNNSIKSLYRSVWTSRNQVPCHAITGTAGGIYSDQEMLIQPARLLNKGASKSVHAPLPVLAKKLDNNF